MPRPRADTVTTGPEADRRAAPRAGSVAVRVAMMAVAWGLLFALGVVLGWLLPLQRALVDGDLDYQTWRWVVDHRGAWEGVTTALLIVTKFGNAPVAFPVAIVTAALLAWVARKRPDLLDRRAWVFFLGALVAAQVLTSALKLTFGRERPAEFYRLVVEDSKSFPSGHALNSAAFVGLAAFLTVGGWWRGASRPSSWGWAATWAVPPLAIAASRVWIGVHYLTDVLAGLFLGCSWAALAVATRLGWFDLLPARIRRRPLVSSEVTR